MDPMWLIIGIVGFLVVAYVSIEGARVNFDDGDMRWAVVFGAIFTGCMLAIGFFVGILVLLPKVS